MHKIVNIHIPKSGGTSFNKSLSDKFSVLRDDGHGIYKDINQIITKFEEFNNNINLEDYTNIDCIMGHILPIKYKKLHDNNWKFITWLREPSQMIHSLYNYVVKKSDRSYLNNFILENNLSIEEFSLHPVCRNAYQRFFYNFPPDNYFFIGIVENYEDDLKLLSNKLNLDLKMYHENKNPNKQKSYYNIDNKLLNKMKEYHKEDYNLYSKILSLK